MRTYWRFSRLGKGNGFHEENRWTYNSWEVYVYVSLHVPYTVNPLSKEKRDILFFEGIDFVFNGCRKTSLGIHIHIFCRRRSGAIDRNLR
jgi:hypothetical protein